MKGLGIGAKVKLGGRVVAPFLGQPAYVRGMTSDRLVVDVTVDGARSQISVAPQDVSLLEPAPEMPPAVRAQVEDARRERGITR